MTHNKLRFKYQKPQYPCKGKKYNYNENLINAYCLKLNNELFKDKVLYKNK